MKEVSALIVYFFRERRDSFIFTKSKLPSPIIDCTKIDEDIAQLDAARIKKKTLQMFIQSYKKYNFFSNHVLGA